MKLARLFANPREKLSRPQRDRRQPGMAGVGVEARGIWTHREGCRETQKQLRALEPDKTKREVSNTVSASGKNHNSLTTDRKTQGAIKGKY